MELLQSSVTRRHKIQTRPTPCPPHCEHTAQYSFLVPAISPIEQTTHLLPHTSNFTGELVHVSAQMARCHVYVYIWSALIMRSSVKISTPSIVLASIGEKRHDQPSGRVPVHNARRRHPRHSHGQPSFWGFSCHLRHDSARNFNVYPLLPTLLATMVHVHHKTESS